MKENLLITRYYILDVLTGEFLGVFPNDSESIYYTYDSDKAYHEWVLTNKNRSLNWNGFIRYCIYKERGHF